MEKMQCEIPVSQFLQTCVDVQRFAACCQACPGYGKTWTCQPFRFEPRELWENYDFLLLQSRKIPVPDALRETVFTPQALNVASTDFLFAEKRAMLLELLELEKQYPGSMALSGGSCDICPVGTCSRLNGQEPCRNPSMMRYSSEALGGDVGKALELYFDQQILWGTDGHMPEYYILLGGLLLKRDGKIDAKEMGYRVW